MPQDPEAAPARRGWRWPAEWEPHAATWIAWPHNPETWPGRLERAEAAFAEIARALEGRESLCILVSDAPREERARRVLAAAGVPETGISYRRIPTDDAWLRDTGPIFLVAHSGAERLALDFRFDAWGGKYPPWDRDDAVATRLAEAAGVRRVAADFVLEGGSVDGNGRGALLTTEACLLNPNRGPGRTREQMERRLRDWLGATCVLWLGDGIAGDDTDGHVDDIARFVSADTVVAVRCDDPGDPDFAPLEENLRRLRGMRDQSGKPLNVAELPAPPPQLVDGRRCPASYANFYLANGAALVPTFGARSDARALAVLRELLPGRELCPVPCSDLVQGLGAVHCLTQQEPAGRPARQAVV
jgi:agmatine deiminase